MMMRINIEELLQNNKGTIVDVRTPGEFRGGSVTGSRNIPLNELAVRMDEIRELESPLILCCASGNRSWQAENFLKHHNIDCVNGGSWLDVNYLQSLTAE
jgi:phage shock protein E